MNMALEEYGIALNLLFIIVVIFVAIRNLQGEKDFGVLVKSAMRPAAFYVVCACLAIFIYYQWLDPGYLSGALERAMTDQESFIESKGGFEEFKEGVSGIKEDTKEEYLLAQRDRMGGIITPFSSFGRASIALITLTFFALFYSLFMVSILLLAHRFIKK